MLGGAFHRSHDAKPQSPRPGHWPRNRTGFGGTERQRYDNVHARRVTRRAISQAKRNRVSQTRADCQQEAVRPHYFREVREVPINDTGCTDDNSSNSSGNNGMTEVSTAITDAKPATYQDLLYAVESIRASLDRVHKNIDESRRDIDEGRKEQRDAERRREQDAKEFHDKLENLKITMIEKDAAFSERLARVEGAVAAGETRRQEKVTAAGWMWNAMAALLGGIVAIIGQAILETFKKK